MIDPERFRRGDHQHFEEVVRAYGPMVLYVARAFAKDPDHADDLSQEIWKRTYEKRASFHSRGSLEAWLHRLATNVCIGEHRARKAQSR